jgi:hypothetical protein
VIGAERRGAAFRWRLPSGLVWIALLATSVETELAFPQSAVAEFQKKLTSDLRRSVESFRAAFGLP